MRSIKHLGDICKINGANIEKVDVITFGAPCQDISIAGKRDGIKHTEHGDEKTTRSGLFFEALRIIREMREDDEKRGRAIQFIRPRYAIYENVGGLTSSNNGRDFQKVLTEFVKIVEPDAPEIPMPEKGGWPHADAIYGVGANGEPFSIAWRLHDAAKWGVPQRRKRYCVLADFNGFSAAEILFDPQFERMPARGMSITPDRNLGTDRRPEIQTQPESLPGDSSESGAARKGTAAFAGSGSDAAIDGRIVCYGISAFDSNAMKSPNPRSGIYEASTARTLDLNGGSPACNQGGMAIVCLNDQGGQEMDVSEGITGTLRAQMHGHPPVIAVYDARGNGDGNVCPTMTGDHNGHINDYTSIAVVFTQNQRDEVRDLNGIAGTLAAEPGMRQQTFICTYENHSQDSRYKELGDICQTVSATYGMGGNNQPLVLTAIPVEGNVARPSHQGDGYGKDGDPSFTLNAVERHGVGIAIPINTMVGTRDNEEKRTCLGIGEDGDPQFTLSAAHSHAVCIQTYSLQRSDEHKESDKSHTLSARDYKDATDLIVYAPDVSHALKAKANLQFREDGETYIVAGFSYGQSAKAGGIGYEEGKSPTLRGGQGGNQIPCIAAVDCRNGTANPDINGTLQAKEQGFNTNSNNVVLIWPEVRRLTPLECTRLQGYPDGWLDIGDWTDESGKLHREADAPKYKAAGNSIALPFWSWLARRICAQYERPITMASLFDGIGGFPLAFERCGAKAVWASEIEPYPIAVTKKHFPEEQQ